MGLLHHWRRFSLCVLAFSFTILSFLALICQSHAQPPHVASTGRSARENAIRSIPFDQLTEQTQQKLSAVVRRPTIYRRMPVETISSDPDMYLFLVRHPEVVVNIWQVMGITKCKTQRTGPYSFAASDGVGTGGNVELVYGTAGTHIMYAEGTYEGSLFRRKIKGRVVVVLKTGYTNGAAGPMLVTNRLDFFLRVDSLGADLMAKTLQPLVGKSADYNFAQSTQFVERISDAAERNGPGVQRLAAKLTNVEPNIRQRFSELAAVVNHRAALRQTSTMRRPPGTTPIAQSSAQTSFNVSPER